MITFGGEYVYPDNDGVPTLNTVGVMQGRICRFNGGCREWYPVLAHSLAGLQCIDADAALAWLVHDAPEVCCADVPTPWKTEEAKAREHLLLERLHRAWGPGLEWPIRPEIQAKVSRVDAAMVAAEAYVIGHPRAAEFWQVPDAKYMEATEGMLAICRDFINPWIAGPLYAEAFAVTRVAQVEDQHRQKRNARARERRAAAVSS